MAPADAGETTPAARPAPARARPWVFLAWCVWLLAWLTPSLLVGAETGDLRPWIAPASAAAAVLAGAAIFLVAAWPFWPALAPGAFPCGESGDPTCGAHAPSSASRFIGLSVVEVLILAALAAPMFVTARSLGGRIEAWPTAATGAGLAVFGIGLRLAAAGLGDEAPRRLMFGVLLVAGGPPAVYYAVSETMGATMPWLAAASPVVALVQAGTGGWPDGAWPEIARLYLWPMAGVGLGAVGVLTARRARPRRV